MTDKEEININNQTITYDYYGDLLTHEKRIDSDLYYSYDKSVNLVARYRYDAWGNIQNII